MKRDVLNYAQITVCLTLVCGLFISQPLFAKKNIQSLKFETPAPIKGLSSNEILKIYQDKDGLIWLATRYGFYSYDGYETRAYKSNLYTPDLLTNNAILCIADDHEHNLYLGTERGLNILNKVTGEVRKRIIAKITNNVISCLLVTRDNKIFVGTDSGLCLYDQEADTFLVYENTLTNSALTTTAIKSLYEDSAGDIWIGTWNKGLVRYSPKQQLFIAYPQFNERNSAHVVFEDSSGNIWVGTWGCGLYLLKNPRDMQNLSWQNFRNIPGKPSSLSDNIIYDISESPTTKTLWIGTRSGLSIMDLDNDEEEFVNYQPIASPYYLPFNEVTSVICDQADFMWISTIGGGLFRTDLQQPLFRLHQLDLPGYDLPTKSIRRLLVDKKGMLWLGIGGYGIVRCDRQGKHVEYYKDIPEFSAVDDITTVMAMMERHTGEIWFGTIDGDLLIYKEGEKMRKLEAQKVPYLNSYRITSLMEDSHKNCWIGTRDGLGVMYDNGGGHFFENVELDGKELRWIHILSILEGSDGRIWLGTKKDGIISLDGDFHSIDNTLFKGYNSDNGKFASLAVLCMKEDQHERLWVGTEGGGLFLYNPEKDLFESVNPHFKIFADVVNSIEADDYGSLWLSTNEGLINLIAPPGKEATARVYTREDGLNNSFFTADASAQSDKEMFFGGTEGVNAFFPTKIEEKPMNAPFMLTDILIYNTSYDQLEEKERMRISSQRPGFTKQITIPDRYNNFGLKFAVLTYDKAAFCRFAYMLEGFDKDWQYTDGTHRSAYYNNLKSGTYKFRIKAANANGVWSQQVKEIEIKVLPPFYATWWAFLIYILAAGAIGYYIFRLIKHRMILQNKLKLSNMEQAKSEEMNHAKLQFFTNITHEILTPLTIISATVDELKQQIPLHKEYYSVISKNINRLMKLMQQILEFRKAETGNLKLRVSKGNIVPFVKNAVEAFRPLIRKRKLHFSMVCDPEEVYGYFDMDKLDKILYNLISNATKYNKEHGFIHINLTLSEDEKYIILIVKDNGNGISKEEQESLFTRFYEGNYRRFNTIGTGIGLSLTKDLVKLWGGEIKVDSTLGQGTMFTVTLPIDRSLFQPEQIDEKIQLPQQLVSGMEDVEEEEAELQESLSDKRESILVVEDEEELQRLIVKLLSKEYNIYYASDGQEALSIVEREEIDLIVTDVMMPVMNGIELCKQIKSKLEYSHIPVIMLTAKTAEEDRTEAYEAGTDGYITKPFNLSMLHARIKNLLRNKERRARDFNKSSVFELQELNYTSLDEDFLKRAIDCVYRHLDDAEFDQPQMMDEIGASKSTLYKKLKSLTGLNPSAFIRNIRLKAACRIMEEKKNMRISELAYAVGFKDAKYFSSCFRKEFGMQPREFMSRFGTDDDKNDLHHPEEEEEE